MNNNLEMAVIACDVLQDEVTHFARHHEHITRLEFFEMGLHDQPDRLRETLQNSIDTCETDERVNTIVLVYGLCGKGTEGLGTRRCTLVIPRAHDCVTLFLGSDKRYQDLHHGCSGCYTYTPGWCRGGRTPGKIRYEKLMREYTEQFGEDNADYLVQVEREALSRYKTGAWIDLGVGGSSEELKAQARRDIADMGWRFLDLPGDAGLLQDLIRGEWSDDRFCVAQPGQILMASPNEMIIKAEYPEEDAGAPKP